MKKILSILLIISLLLCNVNVAFAEDSTRNFTSLSDPSLLQYVEDNLYAELVDQFDSEDYIIENISAVYISQEYLDEVAYNSRANVFFGYTLEELDAQFEGKRYVFSLGDNGETVVAEFAAYDNTYEQVLKNVAVGTGVILVCATVSVVTAGTGLATVSAVFAISAKSATVASLSGGALSGVMTGIVEGIRTGDFDSALKAGALAGSEGFKWGAISGAALGGVSELRSVTNAATKVDDVVNLTDDAINLSDDVINLSDDAANAVDDVAYAFDDILNNVDDIPEGAVEIADDLPAWRKAELRALNERGGYDQLTFQDGKIVPHGTTGSTRPDVVRKIGDHLEAVEVKYYDLSNSSNQRVMYKELYREVTDRIKHLPDGSTQRIVLDVTDRGFSTDLVNSVKNNILELLDDVYPNIPIDVVGLML